MGKKKKYRTEDTAWVEMEVDVRSYGVVWFTIENSKGEKQWRRVGSKKVEKTIEQLTE